MIMYPFGVDDIVTRVFEAPSDGPPILFLHGLTSRADRFRATLGRFAEAGYHGYAIDLPGHGFASKGAQPNHSIAGYRDFVLGFLDRIGAKKIVLVGASLGGHVLAAVACKAPERVEKLVMIGSLGLAPVSPERVAQIRSGIGNMTREALRGRLLTVFSDPRHVTDTLVEEDLRINTSPGAKESFAAFLDYMATRFNDDLVLEPLRRLGDRVDLMLLWGDQDKSVPVEIGRAARRELARARLAVIAGINHTPYIENPDAFDSIVLDFLGGRSGAFVHPHITYT
jgi:pimeloyl-ACP methyl ester carboxylesterase